MQRADARTQSRYRDQMNERHYAHTQNRETLDGNDREYLLGYAGVHL
jgi:hypothetical protein